MAWEASRAYAEEVYASCATIGFSSDTAHALKEMLDADRAADEQVLVELARRTQAEAIAWATRR